MRHVHHLCAVVTILMSASSATAGTLHSNKIVNQVQIDGRPCLFFTLQGVAQADPVHPSAAHFAVSTDHPNYATMVSILLSAKMGRASVTVSTTGSLACSHPAVDGIAVH